MVETPTINDEMLDQKTLKNSEIALVFTCGCHTGFNWKTKVTYKEHFKSNRHISYVAINQELDHRKTITKLQNELIKIQLEHEKLKKMYLNVCYTNLELTTAKLKLS